MPSPFAKLLRAKGIRSENGRASAGASARMSPSRPETRDVKPTPVKRLRTHAPKAFHGNPPEHRGDTLKQGGPFNSHPSHSPRRGAPCGAPSGARPIGPTAMTAAARPLSDAVGGGVMRGPGAP